MRRMRDRVRWELRGGASVEVKKGREVDRSREPCATCRARNGCLESFGEYVRLTPDRRLYLCYLRRDLGVDARGALDARGDKGVERLREALERMTGREGGWKAIVRNATLRLTVTNVCNFHCALPGHSASWCLEESEDTIMPPIRLGKTDTRRAR